MGNMVNLTADEPKKWYLSTGFFTALILVILGVFAGYNTETGNQIVKVVFEVIASTGLLRALIKSGVDFKKWLTDANTWANIGIIIVMAFGQSFATIAPALQDIVEAIMAKNFQAIFGSIFALATIIWNLVRNGAGFKKPVI